jgi:serine/threonine protein kinase
MIYSVVALLSACGWVHRDISPGNVYYFKGRGIVGDFEFAKPINSGKRFETRTVSEQLLSCAFSHYMGNRELATLWQWKLPSRRTCSEIRKGKKEKKEKREL